MTFDDLGAVTNIYNIAIKEGRSTFNSKLFTPQLWEESHLFNCRYVYLKDDKVVGWIALCPMSKRECYKGCVEVSLYVHPDYRSQGVGTALLSYLIKESEKKGYWSLYSCIFSTNTQSIKLHQKLGFRLIGEREKVAKDIFGVWQNTTLLELRSNLII
ncbi:MAG: N-acetyltransferase [Spirochaetales bacterium]|nr:N-acetyltransferase [Spirochaetales bacterium]